MVSQSEMRRTCLAHRAVRIDSRDERPSIGKVAAEQIAELCWIGLGVVDQRYYANFNFVVETRGVDHVGVPLCRHGQLGKKEWLAIVADFLRVGPVVRAGRNMG